MRCCKGKFNRFKFGNIAIGFGNLRKTNDTGRGLRVRFNGVGSLVGQLAGSLRDFSADFVGSGSFSADLSNIKQLDASIAGQGTLTGDLAGLDADYQAVLDYATTQGYTLPSSSQQLIQNQLLLDLKSAGIWSYLDSFTMFATDGDSDFALIDWINLNNLTAVNSPTFTTNQGFYGDGASAYLLSSLDLSNLSNYAQNDASMCVGHFTCNGGSNNRTIGSDGGSNFYGNRADVVDASDGNNRWWFNSGGQVSDLYFYSNNSNNVISRTAFNSVYYSAFRYSDQSQQIKNIGNNASALISANYTILRDRTSYSNNQTTVSHAFIGSQLSDTEIDDVNSAFKSYYDNL